MDLKPLIGDSWLLTALASVGVVVALQMRTVGLIDPVIRDPHGAVKRVARHEIEYRGGPTYAHPLQGIDMRERMRRRDPTFNYDNEVHSAVGRLDVEPEVHLGKHGYKHHHHKNQGKSALDQI